MTWIWLAEGPREYEWILSDVAAAADARGLPAPAGGQGPSRAHDAADSELAPVSTVAADGPTRTRTWPAWSRRGGDGRPGPSRHRRRDWPGLAPQSARYSESGAAPPSG